MGLCITSMLSLVAYPQANEQVEMINRIILQSLNAKILQDKLKSRGVN